MATKFFLLFLILTTPQYSAETTGGFGFTIHRRRDSPFSISYNRPNESAADRLNTIYQRSIARYNFLQSRIINPVTPDAVQIPVIPSHSRLFEYDMTFAIGTPPVEVTAVVDTGSGLPWIQCKPCQICFGQDAPVFDPSRSSSFHKLRCDNPVCSGVIPGKSCNSGTCHYLAGYADKSWSGGDVATENFLFTTTDGENKTIPSIAFGCGHANIGQFARQEQGIIGLDMSGVSLLLQLATVANFRFSYCLVPHFETGGSEMLFGDRAVLSGDFTPLTVNNGDEFYYVDLEDISVGSERLNLTPGMFRRKPNMKGGGLVMDTGTPMTFLVDDAFRKLTTKIKQKVSLPLVDDYSEYVCFYGTGKDLVDEKIPIITFHFPGGVDLVWPSMYSFYVASGPPTAGDMLCFAALSAGGEDRISIIGGLAQQNINVGIDIHSKRVYMSPRDCLSFGPPP